MGDGGTFDIDLAQDGAGRFGVNDSGRFMICGECCGGELVQWVGIVNICNPDDRFFITQEECDSGVFGEPNCFGIWDAGCLLSYDGDCYRAFETGEGVPPYDHFPGGLGECARPGCFDVLLTFHADPPNCTDPTLVTIKRIPGSECPGCFESLGCAEGCDLSLTPYHAKFGIICPATVDLEPCHTPSDPNACIYNMPEEWLPVKSPRGCVLHSVDIICKNEPDPPGMDVFDPDEFTWYDIEALEEVTSNTCCYENDDGAYPCICDEL